MLRSLSVFADTDEQSLDRMATVLKEVELADGELLFQIGDAGDSLYIIRHGKIKIHDGNYVFTVLGAGEIFGEYALIDDKERSASATSEGPSLLYRLTRKDFYEYANRYGSIKDGVLRLLIGRLRDCHVLEEQLTQKNKEISRQRDKIENQRDEIKAQKDMKDKLFSIISHDLRGPVSSLGGLCGIMNMFVEEELFDDLLEMIEEVDQEVGQLSGLMDNLLNYASQELTQIPYNPEMVRLSEIVRYLIQTMHLSAKSKQIELSSQVEDSLEIWADRNSTDIILRNLVGNALKFTPEGGSITVSASANNDRVNINVADSGIGMSDEKVGSLFKLNAKSTYGTKGEKGIGLGLQLVSEFTRLNQGTISLVSKEGMGTTFTINLPAKPAQT